MALSLNITCKGEEVTGGALYSLSFKVKGAEGDRSAIAKIQSDKEFALWFEEIKNLVLEVGDKALDESVENTSVGTLDSGEEVPYDNTVGDGLLGQLIRDIEDLNEKYDRKFEVAHIDNEDPRQQIPNLRVFSTTDPRMRSVSYFPATEGEQSMMAFGGCMGSCAIGEELPNSRPISENEHGDAAISIAHPEGITSPVLVVQKLSRQR